MSPRPQRCPLACCLRAQDSQIMLSACVWQFLPHLRDLGWHHPGAWLNSNGNFVFMVHKCHTKSTYMFTLVTCREATPPSAHHLDKKIKINKMYYSSSLGNAALFLSIISSDREVFKDLILLQPTRKYGNAYMKIFTTDRLPLSSTGGLTDKNIHCQCICLEP